MLQIKLDKKERQSKFVIDSIKLAVSSHFQHIHNNRFKTLPNKSNLLLAISRQSKKKVKTQQNLNLKKKGSLMDVLERKQNEGNSPFLDSHMDFQQYQSNYKGQISRNHSPKQPTLQLQDISIKPNLSRVFIKDYVEEQTKGKGKGQIRQSSNSQQQPTSENLQQEVTKKDVPSRFLPSFPKIPRLKTYSLSYKEILFGKSLELKTKDLKEQTKDLHSSYQGLQSLLKRKVSFKFPHIQLSRSLERSLKLSPQVEVTTKKKPSIHLSMRKKSKKCEKPQNHNISFSPWSTKKSGFK